MLSEKNIQHGVLQSDQSQRL